MRVMRLSCPKCGHSGAILPPALAEALFETRGKCPRCHADMELVEHKNPLEAIWHGATANHSVPKRNKPPKRG